MGVKIRTMWMTPFYLFFGVLVIYIFQTQINLIKLKSFTTVFIILFIFSPFAYAYVSITQTDKRTDYPGKEIADQIQKKWDKKYKSEILYVYGNEWFGGNLSYHLKSRPKWISKRMNTIAGVEQYTTYNFSGQPNLNFKIKYKEDIIYLSEENFSLYGFK